MNQPQFLSPPFDRSEIALALLNSSYSFHFSQRTKSSLKFSVSIPCTDDKLLGHIIPNLTPSKWNTHLIIQNNG